MIFETIILSIVFGKIKGGKIKNIGRLYINGWQLILLSYIINIISLSIILKTDNNLSSLLYANFSFLHILIYFLLVVGLSFNLKEKGLLITFIGTVLNFLPLLFNAGKMPVSETALIKAKLFDQLFLLKENRILTHMVMDGNTKLKVLCDIIPLAKPYPFPKIISMGDILIGFGLFILIYTYMTKKK